MSELAAEYIHKCVLTIGGSDDVIAPNEIAGRRHGGAGTIEQACRFARPWGEVMTETTLSRRSLLRAGAATALAGSALSFLPRGVHAAGEVTFASITPGTGTYGYAGQLVIEGSTLALEMRGNQILGQKLRHVARDDEGKAAVGVRRLSEAIDSDGVKVFNGNFSSAVGLAESEIAARRKVLQYAAGGSEDFTGSRCSRYTFQWSANAYTALKAVMDYVEAEHPRAKRWYTITADYVFGQSLLKYATLIGKTKGIEIVGNDMHPLGERQYNQYLTKVMAAKPDVLCLLTGGSDATTLLRQFSSYGAKDIRVVGPWSLEADQLPELTPEMRDGLILGQNYYPTIDAPANREFVEAYGKKYGKPPSYAAAYGYDSFRTVLLAMEKAGSTEVAKVIEAMEGMRYDSILGPTSIDARTHQTVRPYFVIRGKAPSAMKSATDYADIVAVGSENQPAEYNECKGMGSL